jgi:AraC-like DNA-binding protein
MLAPAAQAAPAVHNKARTAIDDAQGLLAARFTQQVRLEEIAQDVNRSPYHLCRAFKRGTGLPMHHYLNRLRVRASLENVMHERTNLSSLALTLGYSSHSHFSEAFRQEFRLTPTEVRRIATLPRLVDVCSALEPLMN